MVGLPEFAERMRRTPFAWGAFDCILNLADWSVAIGAGDPAAAYRGRYRTAAGAERIARRAGGLAALVAREFEPLGWTPVADPRAGDIGVVQASAEAGGLCLGDRWAVLDPHGILVAPLSPIAAWRWSCPR